MVEIHITYFVKIIHKESKLTFWKLLLKHLRFVALMKTFRKYLHLKKNNNKDTKALAV